MIHLEDYIDTVESLPVELQRYFTLIKELDSSSGDIMSNIENKAIKISKEFEEIQNKTEAEKKELFGELEQLLDQSIAKQEEKVNLASQTYEMVDKHIQRLDEDLQRFEQELIDDDSPSLTKSIKAVQKQQVTGKKEAKSNKRKAQRDNDMHDISPPSPSVSINSENYKGEKNATRSATNRPRREVRSKAIEKDDTEVEEAISNDVDIMNDSPKPSTFNIGSKVKAPEMNADPNEPTYCYCKQVSFGEMIACDNENCNTEWFHYGCVGLKNPPKGLWYCNECSAQRKRGLI